MEFQPNISETTWKTIQHQVYDITVLPWGATEAHNYHLPFGTDTLETCHIAALAAHKALEKKVRVAILPAIPFGVNTGQLNIPYTINLNPSTQLKILEDILRSMAPQGVKKLVILNGHGGNDFKPLIRELQPLFPEVFLCQLNWYEVVPLKKFFSQEGDHANEMETSLMMHIAPRLVLPLTEAGKGRERKSIFRARKEGWVWFPRPWTKVSEDTGIGDPSKATAEKGRLYLEHITDRMAEFFVELALTGSDKMYE